MSHPGPKPTAGQPQSLTPYGKGTTESGFGAVRTSDGGFALGGLAFTWGNGKADAFLVKADASGDSGCQTSQVSKGQVDTAAMAVKVAKFTLGFFPGGWEKPVGMKAAEVAASDTFSHGVCACE